MLADHYKEIKLRVVELDIEDLDYPSKLDRSHNLIHRLMHHGQERAEWFFEGGPSGPVAGASPSAPYRRLVRPRGTLDVVANFAKFIG